MACYRVLAGQHYEKHLDGSTRCYDADDIVTTEKDLVEMFGSAKFEKMGTSEIPVFAEESKEPNIAKTVKDETVLDETSNPKDVIDNEHEGDPETSDASSEETVSSTVIEGQPIINVPPEEHPRFGVDRTADFPTAELLNLKVYWKKDRFKVVDPAVKKAINRKKLDSTSKVDNFLKVQLEN